MASTYMAGVFLTVSTYNGPQFVYHCYDESAIADFKSDGDSEDSSGDGIEWSDESDDSGFDDEDEQIVSPVLSAAPRTLLSSSQKSEPQQRASTSSSSIPAGAGRSRNDMMSVPSLPGTAGSVIAAQQSPRLNAAESVRSRGDDRLESAAEAKFPPSSSTSTIGSSAKGHSNGSQGSKSDKTPDTIFGFDREFLADLLSPPESMCNSQFTLCIDDCILVGHPIHILNSGTWRPLKKRPAAAPSSDRSSLQRDGEAARAQDGTSAQDIKSYDMAIENNGIGDADPAGSGPQGAADKDSEELQALPSITTTTANEDHANRADGIVTSQDSPLRMFHVAFALIPPITEANACEKNVYRYIIVPFVRMLRNEQASRNYVWEEVLKMQKARDETRGLSLIAQQRAVEEASELARALRNIFAAITKMNIARVMINDKARAFQIPLQLELAQRPSFLDKASPHAYLSTSNEVNKEIKHDSHESYGLLLLDDPEAIVQEIEVDSQGPVAAMIRNIDPISSIEQLALRNKIDIKQIVSLVWSLVYWRRARIIIPLNHRYTYAVSPLAPIGSVFNDRARKFRELFPMMPPLQRLLSSLSTAKPKPYMAHVPSTDHRGIYMRGLAWLLQNDFAVHLPTFALFVATRKIKLAALSSDDRTAIASESAVGSVEARVPDVAHSYRRRHSSYRMEIDEIEDTIIADPRVATAKEKRWLAQIALSGTSRDAELATLLQRVMKYFNGLDCLEQIMIHESISRPDMRRLLQEFSQYIVTFKHW